MAPWMLMESVGIYRSVAMGFAIPILKIAAHVHLIAVLVDIAVMEIAAKKKFLTNFVKKIAMATINGLFGVL
jgi:hypothetical protein